eukprot:scaffold180455_cov17-Tisochrysis_lutea.AAC.1
MTGGWAPSGWRLLLGGPTRRAISPSTQMLVSPGCLCISRWVFCREQTAFCLGVQVGGLCGPIAWFFMHKQLDMLWRASSFVQALAQGSLFAQVSGLPAWGLLQNSIL